MLRQFDYEHAYALHSLNLPKHEYKKWCEIDFVIISSSGVVALEVKGGRVSCKDGIWTFTNRFGDEYRKSEGPFKQVETGMFALKRAVEEKLGKTWCRGINFGWGVVFPDQKWDLDGPEMPRQTVIDFVQFHSHINFSNYLQNLFEYWNSRGDDRYRSLDDESVDSIKAALRPCFEKIPLLAHRIEDIGRDQVKLTGEQYKILDAVHESPRVICRGGAGTGKTIVAVEVASREARAGRRVFVVCRSKIFAQHLRRQFEKCKVRVLSLDDARNEVDCCDYLVVDEAQDLMTLEHLELFGRLVEGGMENGNWTIMLDPNNQGAIHGSCDPEIVELVRGLGVLVKLKRNCRNTEEIVLQTQLMTGADIGEAEIDGRGTPVEIQEYKSDEDVLAKAADRLKGWMEEEIRPENITILTLNETDRSIVARFGKNLRSIINTIENGETNPRIHGKIAFSSVSKFKGLENECVMLIDFECFDGSEEMASKLYVGMTRAKAALWLGYPDDKAELIENIKKNNVLKIFGGADGKG